MESFSIGSYQVERLLIKGAWSTLYLARDVHYRLVVIKVLVLPAKNSQEALTRFRREAQILKQVNHPHIVKILGHGLWEGSPYIVMECLRGASLREWILHRPCSLSQALHLILDLAYAVCHLHTHGIVHRDLKPENILVTTESIPKLLDFGIAQTLADVEEKAESQEPYSLMGTPIYMSPEQRDYPQYVSYASDLYSLGIIAYEVILGRLSHGHIHLALMPKGMQKILRRALQPSVQDRYPDIVDFIADLSTYLNSPQMLEESRGVQPYYLFWEQLHRVQRTLAPSQLPLSSVCISGIDCRDRTGISGLYVDRIVLSPHEELFLLAESRRPGAEGINAVSSLKARVHMCLQHPQRIWKQIQELERSLSQEGSDELFFFHGLYFSRSLQTVEAVSYGAQGIWWIEGETIGTLSQYSSLFGLCTAHADCLLMKPALPGRRWIIHTHQVLGQPEIEGTHRGSLYTETQWKQRLMRTKIYAPQDQAEALVQLEPCDKLIDLSDPIQGCIVLEEIAPILF